MSDKMKPTGRIGFRCMFIASTAILIYAIWIDPNIISKAISGICIFINCSWFICLEILANNQDQYTKQFNENMDGLRRYAKKDLDVVLHSLENTKDKLIK